ncbi:ABC transporter permease [Adlercreutzia sp. R25]|uniref:ABC transporter permease n=1 Tax=Adlercreutzia shanghongiae TaxID=3111773 RepID=UPI002DB62B32|nr:ABC transporter permease [Adlercreutzia sp. R25]MEC4273504.1 ABC transporter permease [Adlercreutzia sp. R25]
MLNVLHAQWYRIARNRAFWGLLITFAVIMAWDMVSVGQNYHGQEGYFDGIPPIGQDGVKVNLDAGAYLGKGGVVYFLLTLVLLLVASLFAEEWREGACRSLAAAPSFRRDYVLASALTVALIALLFIGVAWAAVWAVIPRFPLLGVGDETGRFARWAAQMVLVLEGYGMLTIAVAAATKRLGPTLLAALLLGTGQFEILLANGYVIADQVAQLAGLPALPGASGVAAAFFDSPAMLPSWLPAAQLQWMMGEGATPTAADAAPVALLAAVAIAVAWFAVRRRAL